MFNIKFTVFSFHTQVFLLINITQTSRIETEPASLNDVFYPSLSLSWIIESQEYLTFDSLLCTQTKKNTIKLNNPDPFPPFHANTSGSVVDNGAAMYGEMKSPQQQLQTNKTNLVSTISIHMVIGKIISMISTIPIRMQ